PTVKEYQQSIRLLISSVAVGSVNPNRSFIAEEFAREVVALHSSSRNFGPSDVPELRLGGGQLCRRKESHFIRVQLVSPLGKLEWIKRVASHCVSESDNTGPLFWVWEVRRESIDKARAFLKSEYF